MNFTRRWLSHLRKAKGLSQGRLAELCGVALRTIQNWEHGNATPFGEQRHQLISVLGPEVAVRFMFEDLARAAYLETSKLEGLEAVA